ncbi:MAG: hypothetical protein ACYTEG_01355 [Planctomycetota bacterium]
MRRLIVLLAVTTLAIAGPPDLRPRFGDGFTGFKAGSSVRMKRTVVMPNRAPMVTIVNSTLKKVSKTVLTIERVAENPLMKPTPTVTKMPASGYAQLHEKQTAKKLEDETIDAAGKKWPCTKTEFTVTGATGKQVITEWTAKNPLMRVKRLKKDYDAQGKAAGTQSILLSKVPQAREVGGKKVVCIGYRMIQKSGEVEHRVDTWSSRQVPGDFAGGEWKVYQKGKLVQTIHLKVIRFEAK